MKHVLFGSVLFLMLTSAACAGPRYVAYRVGPPPPPPRIVMGVAPRPGLVWADGYYDLRGRNWIWVPGHWVRPPRTGVVWVPGSWYEHRSGWRFRPGYWR